MLTLQIVWIIEYIVIVLWQWGYIRLQASPEPPLFPLFTDSPARQGIDLVVDGGVCCRRLTCYPPVLSSKQASQPALLAGIPRSSSAQCCKHAFSKFARKDIHSFERSIKPIVRFVRFEKSLWQSVTRFCLKTDELIVNSFMFCEHEL